MPETCLFCRIIAGRMPATIVYKDADVTAIRDIDPAAPTHILIMPNRHLVSMAEARPEDEPLLGALMLAAVKIAEQEGLARAGYRLVTNSGAEAGQSVFHLHIHLLSGRRMRWPPG